MWERNRSKIQQLPGQFGSFCLHRGQSHLLRRPASQFGDQLAVGLRQLGLSPVHFFNKSIDETTEHTLPLFTFCDEFSDVLFDQ